MKALFAEPVRSHCRYYILVLTSTPLLRLLSQLGLLRHISAWKHRWLQLNAAVNGNNN